MTACVSNRAATVLYLAFAQACVFTSQVAPFNPTQVLNFAFAVTAVLCLAFAAWFALRRMRKMRPAEILA